MRPGFRGRPGSLTGRAEECGWLRDRYGLAWQIVPKEFREMACDPDRVRAKRVVDAMLKMLKFDIAALRRAYDGESGSE